MGALGHQTVATQMIMADTPMCTTVSGGGPPAVTFHILTEDSKNITTEAGDKLQTE